MKTHHVTLLALGMTVFASSAHAQLVVLGESSAAQCYQYALTGNEGTRTALETCTKAFDALISKRNQAATHVNRGLLYMRKGEEDKADADYLAALDIKPDLTQAYVNHGASLIRQDKYDEALEALNKALSFKDSSTRAEALYNRAIAFDYKKNYKAAYLDLKEVLDIRPDWELAINLLSTYEVKPAG